MLSIKPPKLNQGDTIGIISPSQNIKGLESMYHQGLDRLQKLGFKTKIGKYAESSYYYSSARPEERLEDIHTMFADKEVKMILITLGGY
jgi:muramoyltetrapeptide carboxypeptidase